MMGGKPRRSGYRLWLIVAAAAIVAAALYLIWLLLTCALAQYRREPDLSRFSAGQLAAFTREFPKGGELHIHLSGAPFAERYIEWAIADGKCVDTTAWLFEDCHQGGRSAALVFDRSKNRAYDADRASMINSLSTREPGFAGRNGHDQFFTAFARYGDFDSRRADMIADLMNELARQNTFYVEIMWMPQSNAARALGRAAKWNPDLSVMRQALAPQMPPLIAAAVSDTNLTLGAVNTRLHCGTAQARPGCAVEVRFLVQTNRNIPLEETFAQLELGALLVQADPRWVGLQLVAPEDFEPALRNYSQHMRMIAFVTQGRAIPVALHAGELTLAWATPDDLSFHIDAAVNVAGARRIGHGVSIAHERNADALTREMAERGILVEINLTSNDVILGVSGARHPVAWLRRRGVPVAYFTDDPGISRTDLSHEYERAVTDTGATYRDLVTSARNALAFSFLRGDGLWRDPGRYRRPAPDCAPDTAAARPPSRLCQAFLNANDKARVQFAYERRLADFERAHGIRLH